MKRYHLHIYFNNEALAEATVLESMALKSSLFDFVKLAEMPIGPHPTGMIECQFDGKDFDRVLIWTEINRRTFSALIHEDTGDDIRDHTQDILWLGTEVKLNFDFFELIKRRPDLKIHQ